MLYLLPDENFVFPENDICKKEYFLKIKFLQQIFLTLSKPIFRVANLTKTGEPANTRRLSPNLFQSLYCCVIPLQSLPDCCRSEFVHSACTLLLLLCSGLTAWYYVLLMQIVSVSSPLCRSGLILLPVLCLSL